MGPLGHGCFLERGIGCLSVPVSLTSLWAGRFSLPCLISSSMTRSSASCCLFFSCSLAWMSTREQILSFSFSLEPERGSGRFQNGCDIFPPLPLALIPLAGKTATGGGTNVVGFFFFRIMAGLKRQLNTPGTYGWLSP